MHQNSNSHLYSRKESKTLHWHLNTYDLTSNFWIYFFLQNVLKSLSDCPTIWAQFSVTRVSWCSVFSQPVETCFPCFPLVFLSLFNSKAASRMPVAANWRALHSISFICVTPPGNYMFKVNNGKTRTRCEICSKLSKKIPVKYLYCLLWTYVTPCSGVSIVNFEQVNAGCYYFSHSANHVGCPIITLNFTIR